ncbi:PA14 domain-containing protein [Longispora albida]|uniref:PA14 domain-containing protein n=1 Tax=Longispora albida TaxID=203523 RepID=UPI0003A08DB8|nr:PA14 domain-containing protein [Longispora albida]
MRDHPKRTLLRRGLVASTLAAAGILAAGQPAAAAPSATVTVDFNQSVQAVSAASFGATITGYGNGSYITNDAVHRGHVDRLGVGTARFEVGYAVPGDPASALRCGGNYCETNIPAADWIAAIRQTGAEPLVILPLDGRHDAGIDRTDAVNIYQHLAASGTPVRQFIIGNELNNGGNPKNMSAAAYSSRFNLIADALRAVDPAVRLGGPATSYYDAAYLETVLAGSGSRMDFVDFHKYGQGGTVNHDDATLLGDRVRSYGTDIASLRAQITRLVPGRALGIVIGEYNLDWDSDPRNLTPFNTVWSAGVLGTILRGGGTAIQYGDKNGPLGLTSENDMAGFTRNAPLPIYHGIGMFTGEGLFRPFGATMVQASADTTDLHVFASTGAKNIVLVNTSADATATTLRLNGLLAGTAEIWQATTGAPQSAGSLTVAGGTGTLTLPGRSVTTLVLTPANGLTATYANKAQPGDPVPPATVRRVDPAVAFDWGRSAPAAGINADNFLATWTGQVQADTAGTYTFTTTSDDGVRLWIDGKLLVDAWTDHSKRDDSGQITLTAGRHDIRMEYYEHGYSAIAQLSWAGPGITRQIIPATRLWSAAA